MDEGCEKCVQADTSEGLRGQEGLGEVSGAESRDRDLCAAVLSMATRGFFCAAENECGVGCDVAWRNYGRSNEGEGQGSAISAASTSLAGIRVPKHDTFLREYCSIELIYR